MLLHRHRAYGALIHIYSIGYMSHEGGYYRFFAYLNLFMFFMLTLVLAANYLLLFVGWEGVGLCSYLLIRLLFPEAQRDRGRQESLHRKPHWRFRLSLGMFLIVAQFGSLDFQTVFAKVAGLPVEKGPGMLALICILLLIRRLREERADTALCLAPDAMEGPTPVSALIHAANHGHRRRLHGGPFGGAL